MEPHHIYSEVKCRDVPLNSWWLIAVWFFIVNHMICHNVKWVKEYFSSEHSQDPLNFVVFTIFYSTTFFIILGKIFSGLGKSPQFTEDILHFQHFHGRLRMTLSYIYNCLWKTKLFFLWVPLPWKGSSFEPPDAAAGIPAHGRGWNWMVF